MVGCRILKVPLSNVGLRVRQKDSEILLKVMDEPHELLNVDFVLSERTYQGGFIIFCHSYNVFVIIFYHTAQVESYHWSC